MAQRSMVPTSVTGWPLDELTLAALLHSNRLQRLLALAFAFAFGGRSLVLVRLVCHAGAECFYLAPLPIGEVDQEAVSHHRRQRVDDEPEEHSEDREGGETHRQIPAQRLPDHLVVEGVEVGGLHHHAARLQHAPRLASNELDLHLAQRRARNLVRVDEAFELGVYAEDDVNVLKGDLRVPCRRVRRAGALEVELSHVVNVGQVPRLRESRHQRKDVVVYIDAEGRCQRCNREADCPQDGDQNDQHGERHDGEPERLVHPHDEFQLADKRDDDSLGNHDGADQGDDEHGHKGDPEGHELVPVDGVVRGYDHVRQLLERGIQLGDHFDVLVC
mmetsp:Transcript_38617/g.111425  ORF Transcript_38617/g.111425 Transcript_38617/m.111425 type:complete len:331 (-) Transcript_38617:1057-2049(-)